MDVCTDLKHDQHRTRLAFHGWIQTTKPGRDRYRGFLEPIFQRMWEYFDRYISATQDVPWTYTERSLIGYLNAAALGTGRLGMVEYGCERTGKRPLGRVDWWLATADCEREIIVEARQAWISSPRSWSQVHEALSTASRQTFDYAAPVERLTLCFVRPYWKQSGYCAVNPIEDWVGLQTDFPEQADWCAYYWLEDLTHGQYQEYYRPGLMVFGRALEI